MMVTLNFIGKRSDDLRRIAFELLEELEANCGRQEWRVSGGDLPDRVAMTEQEQIKEIISLLEIRGDNVIWKEFEQES